MRDRFKTSLEPPERAAAEGSDESDEVLFPGAPDVDAIWHRQGNRLDDYKPSWAQRLGPESAWDATVDFEAELAVALSECRRLWPAFDEAKVLEDVYGPGFVWPRNQLENLLRKDRRGRQQLWALWRQQRRDGAVDYDERLYWHVRKIRVDRPRPRLARRPRARGAGRPAHRRRRVTARRGGSSDDPDLGESEPPAAVEVAG